MNIDTKTNNPTSSDSSRSRDNIPSGWRLLGKDEERLASDAYWSSGCKDWIVIGDDRVAIANDLPKWHAIRQKRLAELLDRSGMDISPCRKCGVPVISIPDGLALCKECAEKAGA